MMKSNLHDKLIHLKEHDFQQHCNNIGHYLRKLRVKRDLRTADVEIICAQMQTDFLHSSIGAMHSNYIRTMLKCHQTPLQISLFSCQYKVVSAVIDWMYTGEIQVTAEEYGEYLKVVNSLGVNKLQQNLENTLQVLAAQNDCIICCINIATDPECSVSSAVRGSICKKFIATMHTLSEADIQKLTLNAVTALVASPHIKSKEKIDTVNFALQCVSETECKGPEIEEIIGPEVNTSGIAEINKLPSFEELIKIYQPISNSSQQFTDVHISSAKVLFEHSAQHRIPQGQKFFQYSKNTEVSLDIRLAAAGTFDEKSDKAVVRHSLGSHNVGNITGAPNQFSPRNNGIITAASAEERTIGRNAFSSDSLAEIREMQNLFSHEATRKSRETTSTRAFDPESTTKINQLPTLLSNRSRTVEHLQTPSGAGRNPLSPSTETINRNLHGVESITDIANIPKQFHGKKYFTPNPNHYLGGGRVINNLTEQIRKAKDELRGFGGFQNTTNDWRNREISQESDLQTMNRNAYEEQSLADIRGIRSQFSTNFYEGNNPFEASRSSLYRTESLSDMKAIPNPFSPKGSLTREHSLGNVSIAKIAPSLPGTISSQDYAIQPRVRYTTSEIEDINAHPEFVREDQVIGKKVLTREEYEELREIPSITDKEPRKSPIINRYELPDDEQNDIKNLPDIVDSQYAIGRGVRSEEEIQEIQALPDIHSYPPVSDAKLLIARNICNRPTSGMASSGLLSAYVAPDMRSQHVDSPVSSEYIMHRP